jgi:hypothetical protein
MRRSVAALSAAMMLVMLVAGTASAVPPKKVARPSLVTTVCVTAANEMQVRSDYANEVIDAAASFLAVTWAFKGVGLVEQLVDHRHLDDRGVHRSGEDHPAA